MENKTTINGSLVAIFLRGVAVVRKHDCDPQNYNYEFDSDDEVLRIIDSADESTIDEIPY